MHIVLERSRSERMVGLVADEDDMQVKRLASMWSVLEPYVSAYGRMHQEDADGLRVHQV